MLVLLLVLVLVLVLVVLVLVVVVVVVVVVVGVVVVVVVVVVVAEAVVAVNMIHTEALKLFNTCARAPDICPNGLRLKLGILRDLQKQSFSVLPLSMC